MRLKAGTVLNTNSFARMFEGFWLQEQNHDNTEHCFA